jgi:hypothetical protein
MLHFGQFVLPSVSMGVIERPHSEILGSTVACTYPRLIAACHVLHHLSSRVILQPASLHQHFYQIFDVLQLIQFYGISHMINLPHFLSVDFLFFCMTIMTSHLLASSFISSKHEEIAYYYSYTIFYTRLSDLEFKEVIRPQVPLRPPCYDFSLVADLRFDNAKSHHLA